MSRSLVAVVAVALAAAVVSAAPVPPEGGKGVVFPFPAKAPVVVCLNGYDTARGKFAKMLGAALPKDAPALTKLIDDQLDKLFEGRKLDAVRKNARAFLVLNDLASLAEDVPAVSVLVPVTGYKDFLESFLTKEEQKSLDRGGDGVDVVKTAAFGEEQPAYLVDLKEYAAVTLDRATADAHAVKYTAATADQMGTDLAETFLKSDLAVYVNADAINDQYGDQIRAFKGFVDFALQQAQQQGALDAFNAKQIDAMKVVLKGLVQGVEDCRAVVGGAEFRPEGLYAKLQVRFADGSASAKLIGAEVPAPLSELGKLPGGLGTYTATRFGTPITDVIRGLGQEFSTTDEDARGAELLEQHLKDLAAAGPGAEFAAALPPGAAITVTEYKDADRAAKALAKAFKAVAAGGRINGVVVKTAPRVGDEAEKHRGFTFSSVNLNHDFDASVARLPEPMREAALDAFKRAVPPKMSHWIGSDGKVVVRLTAKDFDTATALLDKYLRGKGGVGEAAGFRRVREQLPAEANLVLVAEIGSAVDALVTALRSAGEAIPGFPRLGPLKKLAGGTPAYVGLAVALKGDTATVTGFVPAASVETARKMLDLLFKKIE